MALCVAGSPLEDPLAWMDEEYLKPVQTSAQVDSDGYDAYIEALHDEALARVCGEA